MNMNGLTYLHIT